MNNPDNSISGLLKDLSRPLVIVISGPSGVGKDAILSRMKRRKYPYEFIVTMTTRPQRSSEKNGIDYNFISENEFQELRNRGGFLESAQVYGNWYGVPRDPVKKALSAGKDTIIKVDIQGAATIKKILPEAIFVFIVPPSLEELNKRLTQRQTESTSELSLRVDKARKEIEQIDFFDYALLNRTNEIDDTLAQLQSIISAEKCRINPRRVSLS